LFNGTAAQRRNGAQAGNQGIEVPLRDGQTEKLPSSGGVGGGFLKAKELNRK